MSFFFVYVFRDEKNVLNSDERLTSKYSHEPSRKKRGGKGGGGGVILKNLILYIHVA